MTTCLIDALPGEDSLATFLDGPSGRTLSLHLAESPSERSRAESLVARMYARMGYRTEGILPEGPGYATLLLSEAGGGDLGTVTVGSGEEGLRAEESYPEEIAALSREGRRLCEFNALAMVPGLGSPSALARLFHAALLAGGPLLGHCDAVVEVTPVHARFYERTLGFERLSEGRTCSRVGGISSVLLGLNFEKALRNVETCQSKTHQTHHTRQTRGLYPFVFNKTETKDFVNRLSSRLFSPARLLRNLRTGSWPSLPEGERSGWCRSGHRPSVPA